MCIFPSCEINVYKEGRVEMKEKLDKLDYCHEEPTPTPTLSIKMACEVIVHAADESALSNTAFAQFVRKEIVNDFVTKVAQGQEIGLRKLDEIETEEDIKSVVFEVQVLQKERKNEALSSSSMSKCNRAEAVKVQLATLNSIETATLVTTHGKDSENPPPLKPHLISRKLKFSLAFLVVLVIIVIGIFLHFVWNRSDIRNGVG